MNIGVSRENAGPTSSFFTVKVSLAQPTATSAMCVAGVSDYEEGSAASLARSSRNTNNASGS